MAAQNEDKMREAFESEIEPSYREHDQFDAGYTNNNVQTEWYGFQRGYQSSIAQGEQERKQLQDELERVTELGRVQLGRAIKAESELAKYKEAKPIGIVRMSNPPDGNPKPIPKWIMSSDQSHLKDGDLLYAHPDNAKEE
jgi:hypothetical protein